MEEFSAMMYENMGRKVMAVSEGYSVEESGLCRVECRVFIGVVMAILLLATLQEWVQR